MLRKNSEISSNVVFRDLDEPNGFDSEIKFAFDRVKTEISTHIIKPHRLTGVLIRTDSKIKENSVFRSCTLYKMILELVRQQNIERDNELITFVVLPSGK